MQATATNRARIATVVRWSARLLGVFLLGFFLLFLIGEGPPNPLTLTWAERLLFLSRMSALVGFVVLWLRDLTGGLLVTGGMIAFYVINYLASGRFPSGWVFPMFFAPGILSLVSWKLARHRC